MVGAVNRSATASCTLSFFLIALISCCGSDSEREEKGVGV